MSTTPDALACSSVRVDAHTCTHASICVQVFACILAKSSLNFIQLQAVQTRAPTQTPLTQRAHAARLLALTANSSCTSGYLLDCIYARMHAIACARRMLRRMHTRAHACTYALTNAHAQTRSRKRAHANAHMCMHSHANAFFRSRSHI
eukprot:5013429-Pleurochrysis_carterae.AAC.1